jgi:CubicO group peptidase (beta-lactamase class C family)
MKQITLLLCFIVFVSFNEEKKIIISPIAAIGDQESSLDSIKPLLDSIQKRGHINGFAVAIVDQDKTLYAQGFGFSDTKTNKKYTDSTVQNIASISKTFIGISLLKAQELGRIHLDDPINMYLPFQVKNPYFPEDRITIRQLATHTSSILDTEVYYEKSYVVKENQDYSIKKLKEFGLNFNPPETKIYLEEYLRNVLSGNGKWYQKKGFSFNRPGEKYNYSNIGATLAALIVEIVMEESFADFTANQILRPLNMDASGWSFKTINKINHTVLYENPETAIPYYSLITYPDGGLISSVKDLGKYLTELIKGYRGEGTLLNKDSYKELFRNQLNESHFTNRQELNDFDDEFNSGIFMGFTAKHFIGHTGSDPGVVSHLFFDPETNIGRILLVNTALSNKNSKKEFLDIWKVLWSYPIKNSN